MFATIEKNFQSTKINNKQTTLGRDLTAAAKEALCYGLRDFYLKSFKHVNLAASAANIQTADLSLFYNGIEGTLGPGIVRDILVENDWKLEAHSSVEKYYNQLSRVIRTSASKTFEVPKLQTNNNNNNNNNNNKKKKKKKKKKNKKIKLKLKNKKKKQKHK